MAIIGILAALVLGVSELAMNYSAEARAKADMDEIENALEEYRLDKGIYLFAETQDMTNGSYHVLSNYFSGLTFVDPWGNAYRYQYHPTNKFTFILSSSGRDRLDGTADDISNSNRNPWARLSASGHV